ncbi:MAG: RNA polymerase subunit sigma-24, partial [Gemmatimonadales bacterium]|nr:RNA polymerase subunit sigma-24 [Gemmatimonadales bacterium]
HFQDMAVGYAYSILGDFHLAEDAAQEAFVQAYLDLRKLRVPQAFPSWLRRIVFKQCDRFTRRKRVHTV